MKRTVMFQALPAALVATAMAAACWAATGDATSARSDAEPGARIVTVNVGGVRPDMRQQEYQLSSHVSAADLDLTTRAGTRELENRIRDTARSVCDQLLEINPPAPSAISRVADRANCVHEATQGAMLEARELKHLEQQARSRG